MKKSLTSLLLAAVAIPAFCQITLDQSNYPLPQSSVPILDVTSQVTSAPTAGNNLNWDYSAIVPSSGSLYTNSYTPVSNDPTFPAAQFVVTGLVKGLTPAVGYYFDQYYRITASGAQAIGIHVPAQSFGLGAYTGNNSDTLYVLPTDIYYPTTPRPIVAFPATNGSAWQSSLRHVVDMQLTVASASLNKAPMQQAFYYDRYDSVIGWGTLQLPAQSGYNNMLPVLQDRISQYCVDSIYVGGSPAPPSLTGAFGITQGQISGPKYDRVVFYRAGEFNYQMLFNYTDNSFSTLASSGGVYLNTNLPVSTGINDMDAHMPRSLIYPNPVTGNDFTVTLAPDCKPTDVRIQDITGKIIEKPYFMVEKDLMYVKLNTLLSDGLYIYSIMDAEGKSIAAGKFYIIK